MSCFFHTSKLVLCTTEPAGLDQGLRAQDDHKDVFPGTFVDIFGRDLNAYKT